MATRVDLLRPSRDGDQFHYSWAARRCLTMLGSEHAPVAITVEGVPANETAGLEAGIDAIDVAEYFGALDIAEARRVRYLQLKHSTRNPDVPWTLSGIKRTLRQFAQRYSALAARFGQGDVSRRFSFEFLTNRPVDSALLRALAALQAGKDDPPAKRLAVATGLSGQALTAFAQRIKLTGGSPDFIGQRDLLERETFAYLPDRDSDAVLRLSQMVMRRATSEYLGRPEITRLDVLEALKATEQELFPAPNLIAPPETTIEREQLPAIVREIVAARTPLILRAEGGVGKSILTTQIGRALPASSETFAYDCFGGGGYQGATGARHRARDGLVQLANEMATAKLCDPLVPSPYADTSRYFRAFAARVEKAAANVAARAPDALLALVIDAADNAEMAAGDAHDGQSFARLMLREAWPTSVRVILTARPERVQYLDPPATVREFDIAPFSERETTAFLRAAYPHASDFDVREFHRLTSHNPRVQQTALSGGGNLADIMRRLGPTPLTVNESIEALLETAVASVRASSTASERSRMDRVFAALSTLRPFVPLTVVAATADVPVELVRSIAHDLSHPLLIRDDSVQFRDEPAETFFRNRFRAHGEELDRFIERLRPLATESPYVASSLPQLMLAAGRFDDLVTLALADADLPGNDQLARRDVQLQRLQFAIKAGIRAGRNADAAALAMKAGRAAAADTRQQQMLSEHGDLAAKFLEPGQMLQQVSRGLIRGGGWTGSAHAYEAAFLSSAPVLEADARSVLRLAMDWLGHWARQPADVRAGGQVTVADVAALAMAATNLHGPPAGAAELRRWTRREMSFAAGRILVARLIDAGRFDDLAALATAAGNDIGLILALCLELRAVGRVPPRDAVARALAIAQRPGVTLRACRDWQGPSTLLSAVTALVEAAVSHRIGGRAAHARLLGRYLPKEAPVSLRHFQNGLDAERPAYLRAYALQAALRGRAFNPDNFLRSQTFKKKAGKRARAAFDRDDYEARQTLEALLPWHALAARARLERERIPPEDLEKCIVQWRKQEFPGSRKRSRTADEVADLWSGILQDPRYGAADWQKLLEWRASLGVPLFIPTEISLARRAARTEGLGESALQLAADAAKQIGGPEDDAESQIDTCVSVARAILPLSTEEAREYFDRAVTLSSRVGQENVPSWEAMLDLGAAAIAEPCDLPELAYRFARASELTYAHCARDKHFDWERTIDTLAGLSPRSAPAQFSRWVDRRFVYEPRYLNSLLDFQMDRGELKPVIGVALQAFEGSWNVAGILAQVLDVETDAVGDAAARMLVRRARLTRMASEDWRQIIATLASHGCDTAEASLGLAAAIRAEKVDRVHAGRDRARARRRPTRRNYARLFRGLQLTRALDLAAAKARLQKGKRPFAWRDYYAAAMAQIAPGSEARYIDALAAGAPPRLIGLRDLFDALPASWVTRAAVPPALARLVRQQVRAESRKVYLGSPYEQLPWALMKTLCGLTREDVAREAVAATGEQSDPLQSDDLFQLVSLLAALMTPSEARETIDRALALYEPLLEPGTGDGPFSPGLVPAAPLETAWAGYVWAALGSPEAARRWQAAHAVRALAALGQVDMLAELVACGRAGSGGAYADPALRFYGLHARLWLLIGLARAAEESSDAVVSVKYWIEPFAGLDETHLLVRSFAARALLALADAGRLQPSPARRAELEAMVAGHLPPRLPLPSTKRRSGKAAKGSPPAGFSIDHDFERNEIPGAALALDIDEAAVASAMQVVIAGDWSLKDRGRWDEDVRAQRRLYNEGDSYGGPGETRHDDLNRYLSFHTLQVAAGKLLAQHSATAGFDQARLTQWLRDEGLSRADGQWRADRRDPVPIDLAVRPMGSVESWSSSADDSDAERHVFPVRGWIAVDGRFSRFSGERREQVTIASALVTSDRARALARAMRGNPNPWGIEIPEFGEEPIASGLFHMEGWIGRTRTDSGIDRHDPWAAELGSSRVSPGLPYLAALGLARDRDCRLFRSATGNVVMRAEQWSEGIDGSMVRYGKGIRLTARRLMLDRLLARTGRTLLVHVRVERDLIELRHSIPRKGADDATTVTQVFLYEPRTGWWRPGSCPPPRRGSRRTTRAR